MVVHLPRSVVRATTLFSSRPSAASALRLPAASWLHGFALSAAVTQPLGGLFAAVTQLSEIIAGARNNLLAPRNPWNLDPSDFLADPFGKI